MANVTIACEDENSPEVGAKLPQLHVNASYNLEAIGSTTRQHVLLLYASKNQAVM